MWSRPFRRPGGRGRSRRTRGRRARPLRGDCLHMRCSRTQSGTPCMPGLLRGAASAVPVSSTPAADARASRRKKGWLACCLAAKLGCRLVGDPDDAQHCPADRHPAERIRHRPDQEDDRQRRRGGDRAVRHGNGKGDDQGRGREDV